MFPLARFLTQRALHRQAAPDVMATALSSPTPPLAVEAAINEVKAMNKTLADVDRSLAYAGVYIGLPIWLSLWKK
jgi:hypothetical protein